MTFFDITLLRKSKACPYCGAKMIGHGKNLKLSIILLFAIITVPSAIMLIDTFVKNVVKLS